MLIIAIFEVGCLPKELGDLANLKCFDVEHNSIEGQLSIRTERFDRRDLIWRFVRGRPFAKGASNFACDSQPGGRRL